jgi:hypothetical protein
MSNLGTRWTDPITARRVPSKQWWAAIMENLSVKAMRLFFFLDILSDKATNLIKAFRFEAMNRQIFLWTSIF